jgi:hypothetical protein
MHDITSSNLTKLRTLLDRYEHQDKPLGYEPFVANRLLLPPTKKQENTWHPTFLREYWPTPATVRHRLLERYRKLRSRLHRLALQLTRPRPRVLRPTAMGKVTSAKAVIHYSQLGGGR